MVLVTLTGLAMATAATAVDDAGVVVVGSILGFVG